LHHEEDSRCIEVRTPEEDELVVPVTVAATASSSGTMILIFVCCCCFPKRCNKVRDGCRKKVGNITKKIIANRTGKTRTFVKPAKPQLKEKSASMSDLSSIDGTRSLEYSYLTKYQTMKIQELENVTLKMYPGYDFPRHTTAKMNGYDFPAYNSIHASSTINSYSSKEVGKINGNLNRFYSNFNIPNEKGHNLYKIKGFNYKNHLMNVGHSMNDANKTLSKNRENVFTPNIFIESKIDLKRKYISRSVPNLQSKSLFQMPVKPVGRKRHLKPHFTINDRIMQKMAKDHSEDLKSIQPQDIKLEIVKELNQNKAKKPTLINMSSICAENWYQTPSKHRPESHSYYNLPVTPPGEKIGINGVIEATESVPQNGRRTPNQVEDFTLPLPKRKSSGSISSPSLKSFPSSPVRTSAGQEFGDIVITGGTFIEVPEGYVFPPKDPKPLNILRLKIPPDADEC